MLLATVLLMNPDSPLDKFIAKDYLLLREMCEHITLYAAPDCPSSCTGEVARRNPAALVRKLSRARRPRAFDAVAVDRRSSQGTGVTSSATPPMDEHASTTKRSAEAASEEETEYLDAIDVSWMDNNVHSMRHNFFNVGDRRPARHHPQREAREAAHRPLTNAGNVWAFLAAPSYVVNPA